MRSIPNLLTPLVVAYALATALTAHAQTTWPVPGTHADYGTVEVVTLADPGHRHYCRVHNLTPDTIVCGVGLARKPILYRRDDIAAILDQNRQLFEHSVTTDFKIGALIAIETGVLFVSPWAALAIAASAITYAIYSAIFPHIGWHAEEILYQRPNTPLTIHLRTR